MLQGGNKPRQSDMHFTHLNNADHVSLFVIVLCQMPKSVDELDN